MCHQPCAVSRSPPVCLTSLVDALLVNAHQDCWSPSPPGRTHTSRRTHIQETHPQPCSLYARHALARLAEHEADAIGLKLMARACFDPGAAPTMLQKLHDKARGRVWGRIESVVVGKLRDNTNRGFCYRHSLIHSDRCEHALAAECVRALCVGAVRCRPRCDMHAGAGCTHR
jgi:hypothetical protein